jgi:perosamine synthetase
MSSLQAALGLAQLERVEELVERKRAIFSWYELELAGFDGVRLNFEAPNTRNTYWMVTAILPAKSGLEKAQVQEQLARAGIATRPFFHPLSYIPAYRDSPSALGCRERNANAYAISPWGINLPSALNLNQDQVRVVCRELKKLIGAAR